MLFTNYKTELIC